MNDIELGTHIKDIEEEISTLADQGVKLWIFIAFAFFSSLSIFSLMGSGYMSGKMMGTAVFCLIFLVVVGISIVCVGRFHYKDTVYKLSLYELGFIAYKNNETEFVIKYEDITKFEMNGRSFLTKERYTSMELKDCILHANKNIYSWYVFSTQEQVVEELQHIRYNFNHKDEL